MSALVIIDWTRRKDTITTVYTQLPKQLEAIKNLFYRVLKEGTNEDVRYLHSCLEEELEGNSEVDYERSDNSCNNSKSDSTCSHCGQHKPESDEEDDNQKKWCREDRVDRCYQMLGDLEYDTFDQWFKLAQDCLIDERLDGKLHYYKGEVDST